jgi:hypothetical protein
VVRTVHPPLLERAGSTSAWCVLRQPRWLPVVCAGEMPEVAEVALRVQSRAMSLSSLMSGWTLGRCRNSDDGLRLDSPCGIAGSSTGIQVPLLCSAAGAGDVRHQWPVTSLAAMIW